MASYKEKFNSSESKAHSKNIATKILRDMKVLRSNAEESETAPRRWIWELIQNAKDVAYPKGIDIKISFEELVPYVKFEHNGKPFSADNIRFLIEQISSKDREENEDGKRPSTGKFGTGFLTTHLLSEIVTVEGVAKEPELSYRKFTLKLDRSPTDIPSVTEAVDTAKKSVSNLDDLPALLDYDEVNFNTSFNYDLPDTISERIAATGLQDLDKCLPYALVFVTEISTVSVITSNSSYENENRDLEELESVVQFSAIKRTINNVEETITIATIASQWTTIAIPVKIENETVIILPIDKSIPKLFCDFPLIGTEIFSFPVIINNPNFNPTDPRDGIFLTKTERYNKDIDENQKIMQQAIDLYYELLDFASANKWENLHLLAKVNNIADMPDWLSKTYFNDTILKPIREELLHVNLVKNANGELKSILTEDNNIYMYFPYHSTREVREEIWRLGSKWFPHVLPQKTEIDLWYHLAWDRCGKLTLDTFANFIEHKEKIAVLQQKLSTENAVDWLNEFYKLLQLDEKEFLSILNQRAIVPDQNGDFWKRKQLSEDAGDIEPDFKDILEGFDYMIRSKLATESIDLEFDDRIIDKNAVIKEIVTQVEIATNDREESKKWGVPFRLLLTYFSKFPEKSKTLFPSIYRRKHILYDEDQIMDNFSKAEELNNLLTKFNVSSTAELQELLEKGSSGASTLLPITQEILASMGITSPADWAKALEDKDLRALFAHDSTPTTEMFVFAQSLIAEAKKNVIAHLKTLKEYDLDLMDDQTAATVLAGILKNEQTISIVFRPAYNNEVIIYYGSERDTLDYVPSELWVDTGEEVKQITLGHIIKVSEINKFPI
jgi:hypothetical protein